MSFTRGAQQPKWRKPEPLALTTEEQELFEERAGIMQFNGNMPRAEAERLALQDILRQRIKDARVEDLAKRAQHQQTLF